MQRYIFAVCLILCAWAGFVFFAVTHASPHKPCLLPSVDAGYAASYPLVCVNTGELATDQDTTYSQDECKPSGYVPCATVTLALIYPGHCGIITTNDMTYADALVKHEDYVPVPDNFVCPSVTIP